MGKFHRMGKAPPTGCLSPHYEVALKPLPFLRQSEGIDSAHVKHFFSPALPEISITLGLLSA